LAELFADTRSPQACRDRSGSADEGEDHSGIFWRVVASGLGAQRKSCGEDQGEGEGKSRLFQVHGVLGFVFFVSSNLLDCDFFDEHAV
jgi:hypothetical protein